MKFAASSNQATAGKKLFRQIRRSGPSHPSSLVIQEQGGSCSFGRRGESMAPLPCGQHYPKRFRPSSARLRKSAKVAASLFRSGAGQQRASAVCPGKQNRRRTRRGNSVTQRTDRRMRCALQALQRRTQASLAGSCWAICRKIPSAGMRYLAKSWPAIQRGGLPRPVQVLPLFGS